MGVSLLIERLNYCTLVEWLVLLFKANPWILLVTTIPTFEHECKADTIKTVIIIKTCSGMAANWLNESSNSYLSNNRATLQA